MVRLLITEIAIKFIYYDCKNLPPFLVFKINYFIKSHCVHKPHSLQKIIHDIYIYNFEI